MRPFEIVTETVAGRPMKNWKNRERSMREKVRNAGLRGDAIAMVHGERRISYAEFAKLVLGHRARRCATSTDCATAIASRSSR